MRVFRAAGWFPRGMRGDAALWIFSVIYPRFSQGAGSCSTDNSCAVSRLGNSSAILIFHGRAQTRHKEAGSMNFAHDISLDSSLGHLPVPQLPAAQARPALHRIADVRKRQGVSVRSAARRMHTSIDQVRRQEEPNCDLTLSELLRWQQALEVPLGDLLVESEAPLSEPVLTRARLLRIMKTVKAIQETATSNSIQRFAAMLEQQLIEVMPELKDVSAWHSVGQRRSPNELGRTAERSLPDSIFGDYSS